MIEVKNNAVLRDGQQIAVIEDGVCRSYSPLAPVLKGQIKKAAGNAALTFELVEETQEPKATKPETAGVPQAVFVPPEAGYFEKPSQPNAFVAASLINVAAMCQPPAEPVIPEVPKTIAHLHALAEKGTIPKPPATHEALGSRTPAFVQWVKTYLSPEDFEAAYRGRNLPTIAEVEHGFGKLSRMLLQQEEASKKIDGGIPM